MSIINLTNNIETQAWSVVEEPSNNNVVRIYFLKDGKPATDFEGLHFGVVLLENNQQIASFSTPSQYMISDGKYLTKVEYIDKDYLEEYKLILNSNHPYTLIVWCKDVRATGEVVSKFSYSFTAP